LARPPTFFLVIFLISTLNSALVNVNHSRWHDTMQNHSGLMCLRLVQYDVTSVEAEK
jgi:hypothetical protein